MMKTEIANIVISAVLAILGAIITNYVVPWIKEHRMEKWVAIACDAAELVYGANHGDEKLLYAQKLLKEKGYDIDTLEIKYMIDAYVRSINTINDSVSGLETIETTELSDEE